MSDETNAVEEFEAADELSLLKQRADIMGIKYHPNIKLDALKAKVNAKLEGESPDDYADEEIETIRDAEAAMAVNSYTPHIARTPAQEKAERRKEAFRLVRVRISCMNPIKASMKGDIFQVGNSELGMIKKYVPFNAEQGWHVPAMLLQEIREKKFVVHYDVKEGNKIVQRTKLVPEYAVEILEPLTQEELKDLANRQLMASKG